VTEERNFYCRRIASPCNADEPQLNVRRIGKLSEVLRLAERPTSLPIRPTTCARPARM